MSVVPTRESARSIPPKSWMTWPRRSLRRSVRTHHPAVGEQTNNHSRIETLSDRAVSAALFVLYLCYKGEVDKPGFDGVSAKWCLTRCRRDGASCVHGWLHWLLCCLRLQKLAHQVRNCSHDPFRSSKQPTLKNLAAVFTRKGIILHQIRVVDEVFRNRSCFFHHKHC